MPPKDSVESRKLILFVAKNWFLNSKCSWAVCSCQCIVQCIYGSIELNIFHSKFLLLQSFSSNWTFTLVCLCICVFNHSSYFILTMKHTHVEAVDHLINWTFWCLLWGKEISSHTVCSVMDCSVLLLQEEQFHLQ